MFDEESLENKQNEEPVAEPEQVKAEAVAEEPSANEIEEPVDMPKETPDEVFEEPVKSTQIPEDPIIQTVSPEPAGNLGYEYVFSNGNTPQVEKKPAKKRHLGLLITGICLAVVFSIALTFALGAIGYQFYQIIDYNKSETLPGGNNQNTAVLPNANVVLEKVERTGSEYGSAGEEVFSESQVVRMIHDAVVVINASVQSYDFFGRPTEALSSGSGVIISADGYVLTCNHVVDGASSVTVKLNDGKEYSAILVGADATSDLAVLKIDATDLTYVKQGCSADLVLGEHIIAIGNALGTLGGTVTSGIISATERNIPMEDGTVMTLIQTDAAINSGNSGGGLFNLRGELIGIVNAKYASSGIEGLAFAIPVDSAFVVEQDLIQYGYVRGVIDDGLTTVDVTESMLSSYRYRYGITKAGLYVVESKYATDLQNKDRIVSINGKAVNTTDEWNSYLKENCKVGDTISILYEHNGKEYTTHLTLREYVPSTLR
ncbi:MAG: trypsin-like peptidase domain-containing protein [Clostridia bacterium]|nr:trypsin-like peptidase domain-containing protein [Clostridia bacterium]